MTTAGRRRDQPRESPTTPAAAALDEDRLVRWLLLTHWHRIRTDPLSP